MHVAPADFRSVRAGRLTVAFALLGDNAYVLAEVPPTGSAGTSMERTCARPHWGFVVDGSIEVETGNQRQAVTAGTAFHIPAGLEHRMFATGAVRLGAFEPVDPSRDITDEGLRADGYEVIPGLARASAGNALLIPPAGAEAARPPEPGEIAASGVLMGDRILTRARFGAGSGYTSGYCDLPHWGLVTAGSLAIEWEDDVEVVTAGDVFYTAGGPPGHRFLAADPAAMIDFTPSAAVGAGTRVQRWRPVVPDRTKRRRRRQPAVETVPLL
jgi:mannose-6-phosphate isomerase-like protein (cupin superfamily)